MKSAVSALVATPHQAETAIDRLRQAGFVSKDISFLYSDADGSNTLFHVNSTKAPEATVAGGSAGGLVGGLAGFLVGLGALSVPGLGAFVAAGPIMSALSAAAVGATVGGLGGCLIGLGLPEYEAKLYAGKLEEGNMLIVVHCEKDPAKQQAALDVFESVQATDISTTHPLSPKTGFPPLNILSFASILVLVVSLALFGCKPPKPPPVPGPIQPPSPPGTSG